MMPGYLDHVLARAFGQGPVLRPRPRSRFEPVSPGPADPLAWPEDPVAHAGRGARTRPGGRPEPSPIRIPCRAAVLGSAPEPSPGPRAGTRAGSLARRGRARAVGGRARARPVRYPELATERSSGDQPPADPTPPRTRAVTASRVTARPPFAAETVGPTARGPGTPLCGRRAGAGRPGRRDDRGRPRRCADRSPGRAPAEPAGPAAVTAAARTQPSRPAARRPARRADASDGEPSPSARPCAGGRDAGPGGSPGRSRSARRGRAPSSHPDHQGRRNRRPRPDPTAAGRRPCPGHPAVRGPPAVGRRSAGSDRSRPRRPPSARLRPRPQTSPGGIRRAGRRPGSSCRERDDRPGGGAAAACAAAPAASRRSRATAAVAG